MCPGVDPYRVMRPSPGPADLAFDEERAWPHAGRPKTLPLILARNEKLPFCSVEQKVGIAARQQARGRGHRLAGANRGLVFGEQPLVAKWRSRTVHTVGARAPSQRMATVPVVAAYLSSLPTPSGRPTSRSVIRLLSR
jgi:hypothetical protein